MLIERSASVLVIVDMQERLLPALQERERVLSAVHSLGQACLQLDVPVVITEHCPERIGGTVPELGGIRDGATVIRKAHFNVMADPDGPGIFARLGRRRAIVCGAEAHVCVLQSAFGLAAHGHDVSVVLDAVGSRKATDKVAAITRARNAGLTAVTVEMVLFELLERGDSEDFRCLLPLIKTLT